MLTNINPLSREVGEGNEVISYGSFASFVPSRENNLPC